MARLWWVNHYAITPDLPGGTRHVDMGRELVRLGRQVSIFASDVHLGMRRHTRLQPGERFKLEEVEGVNFYWLNAALYQKNDWRRALNMLSFALTFLRVAPGLGEKPGVIIGSSPHPFAALAAWWQARRLGVPFWLELRDLWPQALVDMGGFREAHPAVRAMRLLERFLYARAQKIIILAQGSREYLVARGVPAEKILFIPNGVRIADLPNLDDGTAGVREGEASQEDRRAEVRRHYGMEGFSIVYAGAHGPANALDTILEAARDLQGGGTAIQFLLVGDGPAKGELRRKAAGLGLANLRFLDPVPKAQVPELLWAADAAVITLRDVAAFSYAVSPNKLFDYLAAGKPVLAAVPGAVARLVAEAGAGYAVPPEDPQALATAALRLAALPAEARQAMGRRGRALVEAEFCREKLAGKLAALLEDIPSCEGNSTNGEL